MRKIKAKPMPIAADKELTKKIHAMTSPLPTQIKTRTPKEKVNAKH